MAQQRSDAYSTARLKPAGVRKLGIDVRKVMMPTRPFFQIKTRLLHGLQVGPLGSNPPATSRGLFFSADSQKTADIRGCLQNLL